MLAFWLCAFVLLGLLLGTLRPPGSELLPLALVAALGAALAWCDPIARRLALLALATLAGAARVALVPTPAGDAVSALAGQRVVLLGRVTGEDGSHGSIASMTLDVTHAAQVGPLGRFGSEERSGQVELAGSADGALGRSQVGDWIEAEGRLRLPTSTAGFAHADLLARRGVYSVLSFPRVRLVQRAGPDPGLLATQLRGQVAEGFRRYLPEPQATLSLGMLLGGSADLSPVFRQQLQVAGLGHLVAVSGFNVVVVVGVLHALFVRGLGRRYALLPTLLGIVGYTALTGAPPSAVRAAVMVGAAVVAASLGRVPDPLTSALATAAAMGLIAPGVLFDVSFQLSLAATLGLVLLYPRIRAWLARTPRWLAEPFALTVAAELATLPVVLAVFHQVSLVGPIANVLAAPLVPLIMGGAALLTLSLPLPALASAAAGLTWLPTTSLALVAQTAASLPGASAFTGRLPVPAATLLAALLLLWGLAPLPELAGVRAATAGGIARLSAARAAASVGVVAAAAVLALALVRPDRQLHVTVLAAGQGQAVLVRAPDGRTVLVSGPNLDARGLASLVGDRLNVWERSLYAVVVLAPDQEAGLAEVLRRYPAQRRLSGEGDARLELGGAALDVFSSSAGEPSVAVSFGEVWVPLVGLPPVPTVVPDRGPPTAAAIGASVWPDRYPAPLVGFGVLAPRAELRLPRPRESAVELVSDGTSIWPVDGQPAETADEGDG